MMRLVRAKPALLSLLCFCLAALIAVADINTVSADTADGIRPVHVLPMAGAIGPALAGYMNEGIKKAEEDNAQLLVIELNTPGGLLTTTREMVQSIIDAPLPVAVWVTPSGAHAASAGTFIVYASHIAAMDEGTNIGAATPVDMGGGGKAPSKSSPLQNEDSDAPVAKDNESALAQKSLNDTTAFIKGLAEMRGRNIDWAQKAVVDADSITASEALEKNVIDIIATSRSHLLEQVDGKAITLKNGQSVTLVTDGAAVIVNEMNWQTKLIAMITDPNIAFILMTIGIYGLILEFYNPGTMIPGTIGLICLLVGLYALNILPVNAAGIALVLAGIGLMIAETFVPSFGILGFGGVIAFVVGAAFMFNTGEMPGLALEWSVIGGMAVVAVIVIGLIIYLSMKIYKTEQTTGPEAMIGKHAKVVSWNGKKGKVFIEGELWNAYSEHSMELEKDEPVMVSKVEDLTLKVVPA